MTRVSTIHTVERVPLLSSFRQGITEAAKSWGSDGYHRATYFAGRSIYVTTINPEREPLNNTFNLLDQQEETMKNQGKAINLKRQPQLNPSKSKIEPRPLFVDQTQGTGAKGISSASVHLLEEITCLKVKTPTNSSQHLPPQNDFRTHIRYLFCDFKTWDGANAIDMTQQQQSRCSWKSHGDDVATALISRQLVKHTTLTHATKIFPLEIRQTYVRRKVESALPCNTEKGR